MRCAGSSGVAKKIRRGKLVMRTIVFGVDGLTFRVLHPLIERGDLPNFQRLEQEGCEAVLESKYPPLTPPAWVSLSTGLKPARHGIYDFWAYDEQQERGLSRQARVQTRRRAGKAIWNLLSEYGKQVLVINVPMTYPPETVNGIMISGYMTPSSDTDFTYPSSFKEELYRVVPDYEIDLDYRNIWGRPSALELLIDATLRMTEKRIDLTMHVLKEKPWDFCYVVLVGPDRLQHPLWQRISALDTRATEYFRLLDHGLGLILDQLGPDDNLFVVSDHGFQGVSLLFDINEYLYSKGLLTPNASYRPATANRFFSLKQKMGRLGLLSVARKSRRILSRNGVLKARPHEPPVLSALSVIDWERTLACVPSHSGFGGSYADIFLSDDLDPEALAELTEDLKRQVDPKRGKPLVSAVYTNEVFGAGPYAPLEPHLLVLPSEGITFRVSLGNKHLWDEPSVVRGTHQKDGVLYAYGGGIKRGFKAPSAEIYDLVPTVLHGMGLPLPYTFDGRVLEELFVEGTRIEQISVTADNNVKGQLTRRKLGKLLDV
jgi:predicted AlkP superfamily phosphohydrolase/phosphomutase